MTPLRPLRRIRRTLRYAALIFAALLVLAAGAVTRVAGFSLNSLEQVAGDFVQEFSSEALPTLLSRTADARLDTPVVAYRNPNTIPTANGESFAFRRDRPTLVVLLHGATRTPDPGLEVGTLQGARVYWGYRFVEQLLGGQPRTLSGVTLSADTWQRRATDDDNPGDHIVRRVGAGAGQPARFVALLHRDGSDYLGPQTETAVTQLRTLYDYLTVELGKEPQIVLLAHSMGGLVSRYLLSDPPATSPPIQSRFAVSPEARQSAGILRDRTLYLITLSTPHSGSQAADDVLVMEQVTELTNRVLEQFGLDRTRDPQHASMAFLRAFQPSTQHLRSDTLRELNRTDRGLLAPQWARRGDGTLVPVYTLSGRSPGGGFLGNPNSSLSLELALLQLKGKRLGLGDKLVSDTLSMAVSDYLLHNFPGFQEGWGQVPEGLEYLDRVSRTPLFGSFDLETQTTSGPLELESFPVYYQHEAWRAVKGEGSLAERAQAWVDDLTDAFDPPDLTPTLAKLPKSASIALIRKTYLAGDPPKAVPEAAETSDGRIDGDGVVSLESGLGLFLATDTPEFYSHAQLWGSGGPRERGSWYRIMGDPYPNQDSFPWEWGNHSFMQYSGGVSGWLAGNVLEDAGPFVGPEPLSGWR